MCFLVILAIASAGKSYMLNSKITGGLIATRRQFPWQALILMDDSWICGGSLISAQWILTAAHCVVGYGFSLKQKQLTNFIFIYISAMVFRVTVGGIDTRKKEDGKLSQVSKMAIRHEAYDRYWITSDVGLIQMSKPFTMST